MSSLKYLLIALILFSLYWNLGYISLVKALVSQLKITIFHSFMS